MPTDQDILTLSEIGGTVGNLTLATSGSADYEIGEEVIVFAEPIYDGRLVTCAGWEGKLVISPGSAISEGKREIPHIGNSDAPKVLSELLKWSRQTGHTPQEHQTFAPINATIGNADTEINDQDNTTKTNEMNCPYETSTQATSLDAAPLAEHCYSCGTYDYGTFTPSSNWATHSSSVGTGGSSAACRWYLFYVTSGNKYQFTMCKGGGSYTGDTSMWLYYNSCSLLTSNDNTCGLGSEITWYATYSGYALLKIASKNSNAASWTLAYRYVQPSITSVSLNYAPAGVGSAGPSGSRITITGNNFTTKGTYDHVVFWKTGSTYVFNDDYIESWSDTQITCYVPQYASSKDLAVVVGSKWSNYYNFAVDWDYYGNKWPSMPVTYYINKIGTPDCTGEFIAVQASFQTWEDISSCSADFTRGADIDLIAGNYDNKNVVSWIENNWPASATAGSFSLWWLSGATELECDIMFNGVNYTWSSSSGGVAGKYDVQNACTHEVGHGFCSLTDLYGTPDSAKTMYYLCYEAEIIKRSLESQDIAGARWVYP